MQPTFCPPRVAPISRKQAQSPSSMSSDQAGTATDRRVRDKRTIEELAELLFAAAGVHKADADDEQDENLYEGVHPHIHVVSADAFCSNSESSDQESDSI